MWHQNQFYRDIYFTSQSTLQSNDAKNKVCERSNDCTVMHVLMTLESMFLACLYLEPMPQWRETHECMLNKLVSPSPFSNALQRKSFRRGYKFVHLLRTNLMTWELFAIFSSWVWRKANCSEGFISLHTWHATSTDFCAPNLKHQGACWWDIANKSYIIWQFEVTRAELSEVKRPSAGIGGIC